MGQLSRWVVVGLAGAVVLAGCGAEASPRQAISPRTAATSPAVADHRPTVATAPAAAFHRPTARLATVGSTRRIPTTVVVGGGGLVPALGVSRAPYAAAPAVALAAPYDAAATDAELPGGGQVLYPGRRLVALYGHPGTAALGVLGEQGLRASIRRARRLAGSYDAASKVPVVPAFEIITTVASRTAGSDGNYSNEKKVRDLLPWVQAAGKAGVYVVLDLQPGRTDFLTQARRYERLLALPHVGLALDPEWRLHGHQRHGKQVGTVTAREINATTSWLAALTARRQLPQKLVVLHQFKLQMISRRSSLRAGGGELAILIQMDGFGAPAAKLATWRAILRQPPKGVRFGWKNFYDEDRPTFTPARTVRLSPSPLWVSYQ